MTIQNVMTELENEGAQDVSEGTSYDHLGATIHRIYYRVPLSDDEESRPRTVELIEKDGVIKYHGPKPSILRQAPAPTDPPRDFHYTPAEIATEIETKDTILDEDTISISRSGRYDEITAKIIDKDNLVDDVHYIAYEKDGSRELKQVKK